MECEFRTHMETMYSPVRIENLQSYFTSMSSTIFWDITQCSPLSVNRRFGGTNRLHLQGRKNKLSKKPAWKQVASILKMEATFSSETSVDTLRTTRRYIPEDGTLHNHRCENLKSLFYVTCGCLVSIISRCLNNAIAYQISSKSLQLKSTLFHAARWIRPTHGAYRVCGVPGGNRTGLTEISLYFRGVLAVVCVLIATGSCYEVLLSRGEHTNNQSPGTGLSEHKEKESLGKSNLCPQREVSGWSVWCQATSVRHVISGWAYHFDSY
jgi:hypothetical protein